MLSSTSRWVRSYRIFFAVLALIALAAQLLQSLGAERSTVDFFSYFTIQSNLIAVAVLLWVALKPVQAPEPLSRDLIRGAPVLYLAITGIVFALLLSDMPLVTVPFANTVLHKLMPVVMVADWLLEPPGRDLSFRSAISWLIYPIAWLVYTMVRGALIDWYPYPFLNPEVMGGYGNVMLIIASIITTALILIWLIVWIGRSVRKWVG